MHIGNHKNLTVWRKSIRLVKNTYTLTRKIPQSEIYGLISQMNRAAVSIPSNIAESSRKSTKETLRFLRISHGSANELETQLIITTELFPELKNETLKLQKDTEEILKILYTLINRNSSESNI